MKYQTVETAKAIIKIRTERNMTQYSFANLIKMSADAVASWEAARNTLSQKTIEKISDKLTKSEIQSIVEAAKKDKAARKSFNIANTEAANR